MTRKGRVNAFSTVREIESLEQIPNVGPSLARSLGLAGIERPSALRGKDPYRLYDKLCKRTGVRHDPCVLDVFISAVCYMEGGPPRPWWKYTPERKNRLSRGTAGPRAAKRDQGCDALRGYPQLTARKGQERGNAAALVKSTATPATRSNIESSLCFKGRLTIALGRCVGNIR